MQKSIQCVVLASLVMLSLWTITEACGDKFLVVGRGIRYERAYAAVNPGSILIYSNHSRTDPKAGADLQKALKKAGHKIQTVDDVAKMDATLKNEKFDLVMVNLDDASLLEKQIVESPSNPAVLPIIYNQTGNEVEEASKKYDCVLKAKGKNVDMLKIVDEAVGEKKKGTVVKCNWSK